MMLRITLAGNQSTRNPGGRKIQKRRQMNCPGTDGGFQIGEWSSPLHTGANSERTNCTKRMLDDALSLSPHPGLFPLDQGEFVTREQIVRLGANRAQRKRQAARRCGRQSRGRDGAKGLRCHLRDARERGLNPSRAGRRAEPWQRRRPSPPPSPVLAASPGDLGKVDVAPGSRISDHTQKWWRS